MPVTVTVLATLLVATGSAVLAWPALVRLRVPAAGLVGRLAALRQHAPATSTAPALDPGPLPERLSRDAQWDRAADVVTQSIARVATVHELQRSAEQQLDAATYAIQRLFDELSGVMPVQPGAPVAVAPAGPVVHAFAPAAPRREASEAIAA